MPGLCGHRRLQAQEDFDMGGSDMKSIVVGVDGSSGGAAALEYAIEEAVCKQARLVVVSAHALPPLVVAGAAAEMGYLESSRSEALEHAEAVAAAAVKRVKERQPGLECEARSIAGQPAKAILEAAKDAALIIVGSRGRGGFSGLLLGSVSHQVVQHAHCPVVVVPAQ